MRRGDHFRRSGHAGGGATGWRVDQGQHHVLSYFSITYHFDSGDVVDAKTWGNKTGIAALPCPPRYYPGLPEFGIPAVTIEGTIHPLPGGGRLGGAVAPVERPSATASRPGSVTAITSGGGEPRSPSGGV